MSHFTVLVIGNDPEEQLAPYDENIEVDSYSKGPIPQEELDRFKEYYLEKHPEEKDLSFDELYEKHGRDWNNSEWKKNESGQYEEFSTYNPNSKWDWYELGGRWTGFFKLKTGENGELPGHITGSPGLMTSPAKVGYADQVYKKHIDMEGMRQEWMDRAAKQYDDAMTIIGHLPPNETWEALRERYLAEGKTVDEARTAYWQQPRCKAWSDVKRAEPFGLSVDDFLVTKEAYLEDAKLNAISTYAVLKDGKWYGKGEMGWWGMSSDKMTQREWDIQFNRMLDELPDDTLLSVFDCHI